MSFCGSLFNDNKQIELHWKTDKDWGNHLQFKHPNKEILFHTVAKSLVDVFMIHRITKLIKKIIEEDYYYTNRDEIERILDLTHWIIKGEDEDCKRVRKSESARKQLYALFLENIKKNPTIHFDSIVNFRLVHFKKQLQHYVGLAIDEFKQEEDHQAFIDMLRKYIAKQRSDFDEIHILQGNSFTFFKQSGKPFSKSELERMIREKPLYIVGLDTMELNLAPLVAMAPKHIKIYGDNPSEPKTLTVINVFQERATFESYDNFPFPHYK